MVLATIWVLFVAFSIVALVATGALMLRDFIEEALALTIPYRYQYFYKTAMTALSVVIFVTVVTFAAVFSKWLCQPLQDEIDRLQRGESDVRVTTE